MRKPNSNRLSLWKAPVSFHAILFLLLVPATCVGQTEKNEPELVCGLIAIELVFVQVEIEDEIGRPISNMKSEDFVVYEDGIKQYLDIFEKQEVSTLGKKRIRYKIGYYPTNDKVDGSFRTIRVELRGKEDERLKGRYFPTGYFAKSPQQ